MVCLWIKHHVPSQEMIRIDFKSPTRKAQFCIFLYTKFFDWWWEVMPKYLFFLVLGLCAVLILLVLRRLRRAHGLLGGTSS